MRASNLTFDCNLMIVCSFFSNRKCASPRKQNLKAISKTLCAGTSVSDRELVPFREYHEVTGDIICPSMVQGIDHLRDPRLNKVQKSLYYCLIYYFCTTLVFELSQFWICFSTGIGFYIGGKTSPWYSWSSASTVQVVRSIFFFFYFIWFFYSFIPICFITK